jgi:hypothetical protein
MLFCINSKIRKAIREYAIMVDFVKDKLPLYLFSLLIFVVKHQLLKLSSFDEYKLIFSCKNI